MEERRCNVCSIELVIGENWTKVRAEHHRYKCKKCIVDYNREYDKKPHRIKYKKDYKKQRGREKKIDVLYHYGGCKCACCGETNLEFLSIDHIDGNGNRHRKEIGINGGVNFYEWLVRNNYPNGYRVLCHNCNQSLGAFGYCPHQKEIKGAQTKPISDFAGMMQQYI